LDYVAADEMAACWEGLATDVACLLASGIIGWGLTEVLGMPVPLAILAGGALGVGGWALHLH